MPPYTICKTFIKSSKWVWDHLRDARALDMQLKEESITDFFIMNLKRWKPKGLSIKTFTRIEEAKNGSDWEWWFTGPSGKWLGMRIQAKVIKLSTSRFEQLDYKKSDQHKQLIKDAAKHKMIPTYCLYTNWAAQDHRTLKKQSNRSPFRRTEYGAALLSVDDAATMKMSKHKSLEQAMPYLKPLHELFCQESSKTDELPNLVYHNLFRIDVSQREPAVSNPNSFTRQDILEDSEDRFTGWGRYADRVNTFLQAQPPSYVNRLLEANIVSTQIMEGDNDLDNNVDRVTVFQQQ